MTPTLPTGIVSFLFTDVESSTRLWEKDPEGMGASLRLHDTLVREGVALHRGHVFSTAGDAFAAAFSTPAEAVHAALAIQQRLLKARWPGPVLRVRMGVHAGAAEERDGDYFGSVLNRTSRIASAANGGQVLVSSVASGMARPVLDPAITLADLGSHRMKDLEDEEHLFELIHPDLPVVSAPIRTLNAAVGTLPTYLTSFVGRERELEELLEMIAAHPLVVLTGVGGTGKTRLAVEAAARTRSQFADGAWLVELAPVTDPELIMQAIGDVFGLRPGDAASIDEVIGRHLRSKHLLLVLDNCEHLLDGAAAAVRHLLSVAPTATVVATSRESLGIPGEAIFRVPSLGLPDHDRPEEAESVRLFLQRASATRPELTPSDEDLPAITRICRRIDGIPLGLELAAARLRSMSFQELADRIDESFRILSGSAKTALPRQRTLQATIDWSHALLSPGERTVFRRLAMFSGGFDLPAAESVCEGPDVDRAEVIDHLDSLVDKSLIDISQQRGIGTRYRMLEPVRQYAQERLAESGETDDVLGAHGRHFATLVAAADIHTRRGEQMEWERRLDADYDNIRVAFRTFLETGETDSYLEMAFHLAPYWEHVGMHVEGIETTLAGLEARPEQTDPVWLLKGWWTASALGAEITRPQSIGYAERGLELANRIGEPNFIGRMTLALGRAIRHASDRPDYLDYLREGRRLLEENPEPRWWDPEWEDGLLNLILGGYLPGEDERTRAHLERALEIFERLGDRASLAATLVESVSVLGNDADWVLSNLRRAAAILEEMRVPYWQGHALQFLGMVLHSRGEAEGARSFLSDAAGYLEDSGDLFCWASSTRVLAATEAQLGQVDSAILHLAAVAESLPSLPMQEIATLRFLDVAARVLTQAGHMGLAARVLGHAASRELPSASVIPRGHESTRASLTELLGDEETARLMAEGAELDRKTLIASVVDWLQPTTGG